jgi:hypothetical protein
MQVGVDADNWKGQTQNPEFERSLREMRIDFISWHISPEEERDPARLRALVDFCRRNKWSYLFNNEIGNYNRDFAGFRHDDGTYRYDLADRTLTELKSDPLFLGVVYDEADLMQELCGVRDDKGREIAPYFADTRRLPPSEAFLVIAERVAKLQKRYENYGKRLIFEMTFPDNAFAFARGGGLLAPKLLKENYNDLMYAVYRGAALEYHSKELWACIDLWFLSKFPEGGVRCSDCHTPNQLLEALQYAYSAGFDFAYVEQVSALLGKGYELSQYGEKVRDFQQWQMKHPQGDWRTAPITTYVKRFPDGYWGQKFSTFIPDHPYGSWVSNKHREADEQWLKLLNELSHGSIPPDANNWNALRDPAFNNRPYRAIAGLPEMVVFDQFGVIPPHTKARVFDFTSQEAKVPTKERY